MPRPVPLPPPGFDELSVDEKIGHLQYLWGRDSASPETIAVPDWRREILDERLKDLEADPAAGEGWDIFRNASARSSTVATEREWPAGSSVMSIGRSRGSTKGVPVPDSGRRPSSCFALFRTLSTFGRRTRPSSCSRRQPSRNPKVWRVERENGHDQYPKRPRLARVLASLNERRFGTKTLSPSRSVPLRHASLGQLPRGRRPRGLYSVTTRAQLSTGGAWHYCSAVCAMHTQR